MDSLPFPAYRAINSFWHFIALFLAFVALRFSAQSFYNNLDDHGYHRTAELIYYTFVPLTIFTPLLGPLFTGVFLASLHHRTIYNLTMHGATLHLLWIFGSLIYAFRHNYRAIYTIYGLKYNLLDEVTIMSQVGATVELVLSLYLIQSAIRGVCWDSGKIERWLIFISGTEHAPNGPTLVFAVPKYDDDDDDDDDNETPESVTPPKTFHSTNFSNKNDEEIIIPPAYQSTVWHNPYARPPNPLGLPDYRERTEQNPDFTPGKRHYTPARLENAQRSYIRAKVILDGMEYEAAADMWDFMHPRLRLQFMGQYILDTEREIFLYSKIEHHPNHTPETQGRINRARQYRTLGQPPKRIKFTKKEWEERIQRIVNAYEG